MLAMGLITQWKSPIFSRGGTKKVKLKWIMPAIVACTVGVGQDAQAADVAIGVKASTLGISGELVTNIIPAMLNARLQVNGFNYNATVNGTDFTTDASLKLFSAGAIADYYPFAGKFRLSAGMYYNANKITVVGVPTAAGTFTFNGTTYTSASIGSVNSTIDFNKVAPYVGLGWGDSVSDGSPFGVSFELGALYQGTPKTTLTTSNTVAGLAADIEAERVKLQNDLNSFKFYPVISFGLNYKF